MSTLRSIRLALKRLLDLLIAALGLLVLAPLLLIVALAIKLTSKGPVFFRQERAGLNGRTFQIFKFRTMIQDAEASGVTTTHVDDPRITRLGWYLRKYRIDEIPQLLNVLRGEMSVVGPRPLPLRFAHLWTPFERRRLEMRPGMTGWQQVGGAATHTWDERVREDVWYVDHWNLWMDFMIIVRTPFVVLRADTVYGKDGQQLSAIPPQAMSSVAPQAQSPESSQEKTEGLRNA